MNYTKYHKRKREKPNHNLKEIFLNSQQKMLRLEIEETDDCVQFMLPTEQ